jgi:hypothetical protein
MKLSEYQVSGPSSSSGTRSPPLSNPVDLLEDSGHVLEVIPCSGPLMVEMVIPTQDRKFGSQPVLVSSS